MDIEPSRSQIREHFPSYGNSWGFAAHCKCALLSWFSLGFTWLLGVNGSVHHANRCSDTGTEDLSAITTNHQWKLQHFRKLYPPRRRFGQVGVIQYLLRSAPALDKDARSPLPSSITESTGFLARLYKITQGFRLELTSM